MYFSETCTIIKPIVYACETVFYFMLMSCDTCKYIKKTFCSIHTSFIDISYFSLINVFIDVFYLIILGTSIVSKTNVQQQNIFLNIVCI